MRLLVIEDDDETRAMLLQALREAGYQADGARDLASARRCLMDRPYGMWILDWMLPDGSGLELCRQWRASGETARVLVLTARGDVSDRVQGLDAGADDYLRKPFAVAELLARVRALERRGPHWLADVVRVGSLEVDLRQRRARVRERDLLLTAREFEVLACLVRAEGRVVLRGAILEEIWGEQSERTAASLEVILSRLRRKLAQAGEPHLLRTHRGLGYSIEGA